jgi:hypothetical protein
MDLCQTLMLLAPSVSPLPERRPFYVLLQNLPPPPPPRSKENIKKTLAGNGKLAKSRKPSKILNQFFQKRYMFWGPSVSPLPSSPAGSLGPEIAALLHESRAARRRSWTGRQAVFFCHYCFALLI